ncbi:hypothetical protein F5Y11DRAFT_367738 [Daldinia sp. FL1419]|nr:hypothetical protein F5Y11DRAFT_367738 [Daldinia sp. FL1419]
MADLPPQENVQVDGFEDPFELRSAGSKGLGLYATKDLRAGDRVLVERCAITQIHYPDFRQRYNSLIESYGLLNPRDAARVQELYHLEDPNDREILRPIFDGAPHLSEADIQECIAVRRIHAANNFQIRPAQTDEEGNVVHARSGVFVKASRFNHSCDPNCYYDSTGMEGIFSCAAARPIKKGEELTIPYISYHATTEQRQADLSNWGFQCQCNKCEGRDSEYDAQLEEAYEAQTSSALPREPEPPGLGDRERSERRILRRIELLEELQWHGELFFAYGDAAAYYNQLYSEANELPDNMYDRLRLAELCLNYSRKKVEQGGHLWGPGDLTYEDAVEGAETMEYHCEHLRKIIAELEKS